MSDYLHHLFTDGEREVLLMAFSGLTAKEVARETGRCYRTVQWHLANAYDKLGVNSLMQARNRVDALGGVDALRRYQN